MKSTAAIRRELASYDEAAPVVVDADICVPPGCPIGSRKEELTSRCGRSPGSRVIPPIRLPSTGQWHSDKQSPLTVARAATALDRKSSSESAPCSYPCIPIERHEIPQHLQNTIGGGDTPLPRPGQLRGADHYSILNVLRANNLERFVYRWKSHW